MACLLEEMVDTHRAVAVWSGSSEAGENPRWAPGKAPLVGFAGSGDTFACHNLGGGLLASRGWTTGMLLNMSTVQDRTAPNWPKM